MKRRIFTVMLCVCLLAESLVYGEGLLPTLTNAYGVAMPSLTEALRRYPESEETVDGAAVEHWAGITEDDFNAFGVYLKKGGAKLQDYRVEGSVFTATITQNGRTFSFVFDTDAETAVITYPAGTYDEHLFAVKSVWNAAEAAETAGKYTEAAEKYASLIHYEGASVCYRDSDQRKLRCYYADGEAKRTVQDWEGAVTAFAKAGSYSDAAIQIKETRYQQATTLLQNGDSGAAYAVFNKIKGYKDVDSLLKNDHDLLAVAAAVAAHEAKLELFKTAGSYVTFGTYPQTANGTDNTPIEWLVLEYDAKNNRALLLSRYGLDAQPYNTYKTDITWEKSSMRSWLNRTFMEKAFSAKEQSAIVKVKVDNSKSQGYSGWYTSGGNNTQDKIFLLSYAEANKYFGVTEYVSNNTKSRVTPTAYAKKQGAYSDDSCKTTEGSAAGWWWLRSPGRFRDYAAYVYVNGSLSYSSVDDDDGVVRPALWINLESDIF